MTTCKHTGLWQPIQVDHKKAKLGYKWHCYGCGAVRKTTPKEMQEAEQQVLKRMKRESGQIDAHHKFLRKAILLAQKGAVSTQDIVGVFLDEKLYDKLYRGMGSAKKAGALTLSAKEASELSFAVTAMANSFMDAAKYIRKQVPRKGEK